MRAAIGLRQVRTLCWRTTTPPTMMSPHPGIRPRHPRHCSALRWKPSRHLSATALRSTAPCDTFRVAGFASSRRSSTGSTSPSRFKVTPSSTSYPPDRAAHPAWESSHPHPEDPTGLRACRGHRNSNDPRRSSYAHRKRPRPGRAAPTHRPGLATTQLRRGLGDRRRRWQSVRRCAGSRRRRSCAPWPRPRFTPSWRHSPRNPPTPRNRHGMSGGREPHAERVQISATDSWASSGKADSCGPDALPCEPGG
jgi:hypothetical protein